MEEAAADEDAIDGGIRIDPFREVKSTFNQQKVTVRVPDADG